MKKQFVVFCVVAGLASQLAIADPMVVETVDKAFYTTIHSPDGKGSFILGGQKGQDIMRMGHTKDPLHLDVAVVGNLEKPQCKRLHVRWSEAGVIQKRGAAPQDMAISFKVNYCTDTQLQYGLTPDKKH